MATPERDTGTGYERKPSTYNADLTEVGHGTPMGELMRRYWHPIGLAADAGDTPKAVRALGEDLILFRDGEGRPGLVTARCCHRGTTLYYGHVEERGIRCCYHGWLFDVARPLPGAAVRARRRAHSRTHPPALVSGRGALRIDFRLHGAARRKAGAAALRMPGESGRRRIGRGGRHQHRQRRRRDRAVQLAAALGEHRRTCSTSRSCTARSAACSSSRRWESCRR